MTALAWAGLWRGADDGTAASRVIDATAEGAVFVITWILVATRLRVDLVPTRNNQGQMLRRVAESWATTWGIGGLLSVTLAKQPPLDVWTLLMVGFVLLAGCRLLLASTPLGSGASRPRTLVVGACASARSLTSGHDSLDAMNFVGFVGFPGESDAEMSHLPKLGSAMTDLRTILRNNDIDLALVSPSENTSPKDVHHVFKACDELGLGVHYFPSFLDLEHLKVGLTWCDERACLTMNSPSNHSLPQLAKRVVDVIGSALGVLALLPVFVGCALAVKLTSKGPVFFRQVRVGKNGRTFNCLKFRTMVVGAHMQQDKLREANTQDGPAFKIPEDPRVTAVGRVLRKFSLDELPQLLNVLAGDMSIVGPRPPVPGEVEKYTWWQQRRISVKPGLTCVWQVWGRNRVSFKRWVEMDLYYIDNWSLWLDLKLIAHTFRVVWRGTGM